MSLPPVQQRLDDALAARHKLLTGTKMVSVGFGKRQATYQEADLARLDAYIADLRRELAGNPRRGRSRIRYVVPD